MNGKPSDSCRDVGPSIRSGGAADPAVSCPGAPYDKDAAMAGKQAPARRTQAPASHPHVPAGDTAAGATSVAPGLVIVKRSISDSEMDAAMARVQAPPLVERKFHVAGY